MIQLSTFQGMSMLFMTIFKELPVRKFIYDIILLKVCLEKGEN